MRQQCSAHNLNKWTVHTFTYVCGCWNCQVFSQEVVWEEPWWLQNELHSVMNNEPGGIALLPKIYLFMEFLIGSSCCPKFVTGMAEVILAKRCLFLGIIFLSVMTFTLVTNMLNQPVPSQAKFYQKWKPISQPIELTKPNTQHSYRWKPGLQFHHTCKKHKICPGRSCCETNKYYQELHLAPENLSMNDTVETFKRKTYNKTLVFVGDSITNQLYVGFWDVLDLNFDHTSSKTHSKCTCNSCKGMQPSTGMKLVFWEFRKIGTPPCANLPDYLCMPHWKFQSIVSKSDIILLNMGLHYHFHPKQDYAATLTKLADILHRAKLADPEKQVIFRSTLPQHFLTKDGWYRGKGAFKGRECSSNTSHREHWTNQHLKNIAEHYRFKYMDSAPFYIDRWDLHWNPQDCTHSCLTAEVTIPEMALLNSLLNWVHTIPSDLQRYKSPILVNITLLSLVPHKRTMPFASYLWSWDHVFYFLFWSELLESVWNVEFLLAKVAKTCIRHKYFFLCETASFWTERLCVLVWVEYKSWVHRPNAPSFADKTWNTRQFIVKFNLKNELLQTIQIKQPKLWRSFFSGQLCGISDDVDPFLHLVPLQCTFNGKWHGIKNGTIVDYGETVENKKKTQNSYSYQQIYIYVFGVHRGFYIAATVWFPCSHMDDQICCNWFIETFLWECYVQFRYKHSS